MPNETSGATPSAPQKDYSALYLPGAIVLAGLIISLGLFFGLSGSNSASIGDTPQPPKDVNVKEVKIAGFPFIGKENAPLTMVYWFDYQCPFCKAVDVGHPQIPVQPSMPILLKEYVETGKLKIVFKDYAFLGPDSLVAAEYKRAVWDSYPDKFYTWHEEMMKAQDEEHAGFGNEASILELIKKIPGLDANKLKSLVATNKAKYDADIVLSQQEGSKFGIQGTPGFIIGNKSIDGAVDIAQFKAVIDPQLK